MGREVCSLVLVVLFIYLFYFFKNQEKDSLKYILYTVFGMYLGLNGNCSTATFGHMLPTSDVTE